MARKKRVEKPVKKQTKKKKEKHPGGRPTLFTDEIKEEIYKVLKTGATYTRACLMAGVSLSLFFEWKKNAKDAIKKGITNEFTEFLDKVEQAKAYYITVLHNVVNKKAYNDPEWAMKMLEKKARDEFGDVEKIEIDSHNTNTNTNVNVNPKNSDKDLEETIDILRAVRGLEEKRPDQEVSDPETE